MTTKRTSPISVIFASKCSRSDCKLKARRPLPSSPRTAVTINTFFRSAPAAIRRGTTVSLAPSSAHKNRTLPSGAVPSLQGHEPPLVTVAPIEFVSCDLPRPASPPTSDCLPTAIRPGHRNSTRSGEIPAAHWTTSLLSRSASNCCCFASNSASVAALEIQKGS